MLGTTKSIDNINQMFQDAYSGPLSKDTRFAQELKEVQKYYEFYDGFDIMEMDKDYGQTWKTPNDMDYKPTKDIRNYTKKLIDKQARFMSGSPAQLVISAVNKGEEERAEKKRVLIDEILQRAKFWSKMSKALIDSTIGKRVLMMVIANEGEPINIRFYPMPQFNYVMDPDNNNELLSVDIVYQDERTIGKDSSEQLWHHYSYEMKTSAEESAIATATEETTTEPECWLTYKMTDGADKQLYVARTETEEDPTRFATSINEAKVVVVKNSNGEEVEVPMIIKESAPTGLSRIPAYVIRNESLTGDIYGHSDLKDLVPIADNYNRTISDLRDALKFRMFEQPVIIDGDSKSVSKLKIAPNALIDLKTDPKLSMGNSSRQAAIQSLSSSFNFMTAAQYYLDDTKRAMYELMDQPLPEKVQEAPSGKAMKFLFYDLMSRCNRKWIEWDDAIVWLISMATEVLGKVPNMYDDMEPDILNSINVETTEYVKPVYPLPEDENEERQTAINEVAANVRSIRSYIKTYSEAENEQSEFENILEELGLLDEVQGGGFRNLANATANEEPGGGTEDETNEEDEESNEEEGTPPNS